MQSTTERITVQERLIETFDIRDTCSNFMGWLDNYGWAKNDSFLPDGLKNLGAGLVGWHHITICYIWFTAKILEPELLSVTAELRTGQEDGETDFFTTTEAIDYFRELAAAIRQRYERDSPYTNNPINEFVLPDELTERQREVANCLAQGLNDKQIAETLVISAGTVKKHRQKISPKWKMNTTDIKAMQAEAKHRRYG